MTAALKVKIMARQCHGNKNGSHEDLLRFLPKENARKFAMDFLQKPRDINYFVRLWRGAKKLCTADRLAMQHVLGMEIDMLNIMWLYRLKRFYGIIGEVSYGYLIPIRHKLCAENMDKMVACADTQSLQAVISATVYRNIFGDFSTPEKSLNTAILARYKSCGKRSLMALLCGYLYGEI